MDALTRSHRHEMDTLMQINTRTINSRIEELVAFAPRSTARRRRRPTTRHGEGKRARERLPQRFS